MTRLCEVWTPMGYQDGWVVTIGGVEWFIPDVGGPPIRRTPKARTPEDAFDRGLCIGFFVAIAGATFGCIVWRVFF